MKLQPYKIWVRFCFTHTVYCRRKINLQINQLRTHFICLFLYKGFQLLGPTLYNQMSRTHHMFTFYLKLLKALLTKERLTLCVTGVRYHNAVQKYIQGWLPMTCMRLTWHFVFLQLPCQLLREFWIQNYCFFVRKKRRKNLFFFLTVLGFLQLHVIGPESYAAKNCD